MTHYRGMSTYTTVSIIRMSYTSMRLSKMEITL
ncbi:unnamed protein product [Angiostrongylus costaricensis]|uniref:Uncharacterized protein n=1 Tax=Angiostrongylus costaricensis TaxID=334426 RepID=A0A0R3PB17_ANGCS|nr:unnamed protein product [Angiostrongylus costaricensis]